MKFCGNPYSGSCADTRGQRDREMKRQMDGWTDMKLAGPFRDFMNTPKNWGVRNKESE